MKPVILLFLIVGYSSLFAQNDNENLDSLKSIPIPPQEDEIGWVQVPEYSGGKSAMISFISNEFTCPVEASEVSFKQRILVFPLIDSLGTILKVDFNKDYGCGINEEISKVFKSMPKWKPARSGGKNINLKYRVDIFIDCTLDSNPTDKKKKSKKK